MEVIVLAIVKDKLGIVNTGSDSITILEMNDNFRCQNFFLCEGKPYLGPHQIIQEENKNIFYTTNSYDNSIYKINIHKKTIEDILLVGCYPSHIDILDNYLLVTNSDSNSISVIDRVNFELIENIPVGEKPHDIKVDKKTKKVYVANSNNYTIDVLDIYTNSINAIKLPFKPLHMFLGKEKAYVLCPLNNGMINSKIIIIDLQMGIIEHCIEINGVINDMVIIEQNSVIYTSNIDDGYMYKIDMDKDKPSEKYYIGGMPNNLLFNNKYIYITNVQSDCLHVFDVTKREIIKTIKTGKEPSGLLVY
ncbi:MAG: YncE family protein [Firmicutes bacterium]|nr:YncE family protein [Bacillota bacterium]